MINLNRFVCVEINEYDTIAAGKNNPTRNDLKTIRPRVSVDYNTYNNSFSTIHTRPASAYSDDEKTTLHKAYGDTSAVDKLKTRIINAQIDDFKHICPSCLYHKRQETDHYIPKEKYPEFAVLASNLIPICSTCNKKKSQNWRDAPHTTRTFIHFYNDIAPNIRFLSASLIINNNIPRLDWSIQNTNNAINNNLYTIIEYHFERLDLLNRYSEAANDLLSELKRTVASDRRRNPNLSTADISQILMDDAIVDQNIYGINYWKSIARIVLANDQQYLNTL